MTVRVIDVDNSQVVRAQVDRATACFYPGNKNRVVVVADAADFGAAIAALEELRAHAEPGEYLGCMDCGGRTWSPDPPEETEGEHYNRMNGLGPE
ncbi:hypothetical protein KAYACHO_65 [Mycobacterium phage KayaCho]|uniref:hypothetical protein n=1 Tax=Mycobacterium phage KayaCho TaxID=1340830 RepID=UPI0003881B25|nr:hypothetical protein N846_gp65 [Mycobacterium phage KayaCho]AGT12969.1 hypothetical protein KAYACHO_65 [Mycobacterium phage KayaCho]